MPKKSRCRQRRKMRNNEKSGRGTVLYLVQSEKSPLRQGRSCERSEPLSHTPLATQVDIFASQIRYSLRLRYNSPRRISIYFASQNVRHPYILYPISYPLERLKGATNEQRNPTIYQKHLSI